METIFIDTQFVVALINTRDEQHTKAVECAQKYEQCTFLVTDAILLEIGNVLARRFRREAAGAIQSFLESNNTRVFRLTQSMFSDGFDLYRTHSDKDWGLTDCCSFVVMRHVGIDAALTFDQHFVQAGFRALMRE